MKSDSKVTSGRVASRRAGSPRAQSPRHTVRASDVQAKFSEKPQSLAEGGPPVWRLRNRKRVKFRSRPRRAVQVVSLCAYLVVFAVGGGAGGGLIRSAAGQQSPSSSSSAAAPSQRKDIPQEQATAQGLRLTADGPPPPHDTRRDRARLGIFGELAGATFANLREARQDEAAQRSEICHNDPAATAALEVQSHSVPRAGRERPPAARRKLGRRRRRHLSESDQGDLPADQLSAGDEPQPVGAAGNENWPAGGELDAAAPSARDKLDDYNLFEPEASSAAPPANPPAGEAENQTCVEVETIVQSRPSKVAGRFFILCYVIVFVSGLFGNVITLYVLVCKGQKCQAQDVLLGNLALSDIMLCVFAVPITPKYLVVDYYWKMGSILCKMVSFTQSVSVYMSTYSLIAIGYIRYRLIVHPLENVTKKAGAIWLCLGTLFIGIVTTLPYVLKVHLSPEHCEVKFCDEAWVGSQRFYFSLFTCIFQFVIPLVAVIFFYFNIYKRLDLRAQTTCGGAHAAAAANTNTAAAGASKSQSKPTSGDRGVAQENTTTGGGGGGGVLALMEIRHRERQRRMKKNNMRLIFVVLMFAHSWLPLNVYNILADYYDGLSSWAYLTNAFLVTHLIACSSVIWNPILYAWMSDSYQMDLKCAMPKCLAAKFKSCLNEPSTASGPAPGGQPGGATSVVLVSTNGNNQLAGHKRFFDFQPGGLGGGSELTASSPNGLASLARQSNCRSARAPARTKSIDQISEACLAELALC